MKILLTIHHDLNPNTGAPGVTWCLGQEYKKLGHQVYYYSFSNLPTGLPEIVRLLIFSGYFTHHVTRLMQQHSIDVIDASTGDAWIWGKFRDRTQRPLLVTRSHGLEHILHAETLAEAARGNVALSWKYPYYHGGYRLWEVATSLRQADLALFTNRFDLSYAVDHLGVRPDRAHTFINGVPYGFIGLPYESTPSHQRSPIRIAQIGSYIPRKGIHYGIPALNRILLRYSQVEVSFLATCCPASQVYADFDTEVRDRIQVIPHYDREALPALLQGHHIKLLPSLSEGFSLALPEAMACGLVPVTTAIPGSMAIIKDYDNGILVPVRDSGAIEQALEQLICDRALLEKLRRKAYTTAQSYGWQTIAKDTLNLYQQAIDRSDALTRTPKPSSVGGSLR